MRLQIEGEAAVAAVRAENAKRRQADLPCGVLVMTFGCQQNEADSEKLLGMATSLGYTPTDDPARASLILVNTCAIREHAEQRVLSIIGGLKKHKEKTPGLLIGVCGCMTAQAHRVEQLKKSYPYVDFTLDPAVFHRLPELIAGRMLGAPRRFLYGEEQATVPEGIPTRRTLPHRGKLSIMYGCNNFCSYCIVPYVRGRERSRESAAILAEARELIASGCRDIMLLGQNVNSYRGDCDFPTLLERLAALPGDFTLRFMTSHPKDASDRLIEVIGQNHKIAPAFHLPLQSGSDRILAAMNRRYDTARYLGIVEKLRAARPGIVLTSDIIVGFPGETEEDFEMTLDILRRVRFDMVYSFLYSPRRGTPAAEMEGAVDPAVKGARMQRLLDLQTAISAELGAAYEGRTLRVLGDGPSKADPAYQSARTDGGKLVHVKTKLDITGQWKTVKIERADAYAMYATPLDEEKEIL